MSDSSAPWILALVFTPIGLLLGGGMYVHIRRTRGLVRSGARAQGVVSGLEPTQMKGPGSESTITVRTYGDMTAYYPVVTWTTAEGRAMETRWNIARPRERTLAVGTRVEVRYDPANPDRWTLPDESSALWWLFVGVGALFALIGLGFFVGLLFM
ncbi:DUF3592 domain-containing protein [Streptomyces reniochalinae]|uniref:DUF3592 domain-containing protein n=1 Tax=Streptomyces reniochalinae TaxID=2250578 RepID=A0A367EBF5_9ACTN|nr:DUF3592 domain-containing protein [Streptomyces reniochalinae]RCG14570.1 DUF3592 domain-containing protein [Streptomyces reniochalinae]